MNNFIIITVLVCITFCELQLKNKNVIYQHLSKTEKNILKCNKKLDNKINSNKFKWEIRSRETRKWEKLKSNMNFTVSIRKRTLEIEDSFLHIENNETEIAFLYNSKKNKLCQFILIIGEKCLKKTCLKWYNPIRTKIYNDCEYIKLSCYFYPVPPISGIQWLRNEILITENNNFIYNENTRCNKVKTIFVIDGNALIINEADEKTSGNFTCRYNNIQHTFHVIIHPYEYNKQYVEHTMPVIIEKPMNRTIKLGDDVEVKCILDRVEPVYWKIYSKKWNNYSDIDFSLHNKYQKKNNFSLLIKNFTESDENIYRCAATLSIKYNKKDRIATFSLSLFNETSKKLKKLGCFQRNKCSIAVYIIITLVIITVCLILTILYIRKMDKQRRRCLKKLIIMKSNEIYNFSEYSTSSPLDNIQLQLVPCEDNNEIIHIYGNTIAFLPSDNDKFINWENIKVGLQIGQGAFGQVFCADLNLNGVITKVAAKKLREDATDRDVMDMWKEFERMKRVGSYINIISLIGYTTYCGNLYLITEYAVHGNLQLYLRNHSPYNNQTISHLDNMDLVIFSWQIARGMKYLAERMCIHRDLAARNVLIAENNVAKIADFGLSRELTENDYYRLKPGGRIPIKWVPPETLFSFKYTIMSDVWAYGIVLWEIFSFGAEPYPDYEPSDLFKLLNDGYRMKPDKFMPKKIEIIMNKCWHEEPTKRPLFSNIVDETNKIIDGLHSVFNTTINDPENRITEEIGDEHTCLLSDQDISNLSPRISSSDSQYSSMPEDHRDTFDGNIQESDL